MKNLSQKTTFNCNLKKFVKLPINLRMHRREKQKLNKISKQKSCFQINRKKKRERIKMIKRILKSKIRKKRKYLNKIITSPWIIKRSSIRILQNNRVINPKMIKSLKKSSTTMYPKCQTWPNITLFRDPKLILFWVIKAFLCN